MTDVDAGVAATADIFARRPRGEFAHLQRCREPGSGLVAVKILPGEYYATSGEEVVTTLLGSCVSACIHDPASGIGGMNHFMLPEPAVAGGRWGGTAAGRSARYGSEAMERLINAVLKAGGDRRRLVAKVFGGGRILAHMTDVGARNIEFVHRYLCAESLQLIAEDTGGTQPRQVRFYPHSGRAQVRRLDHVTRDDLADRDRRYLKELAVDPIQGEVELF